MSQFGKMLYRIRKGGKMSRDFLADLSGVSRASIQRYETSDALPGKETFEKLINALSLTNKEEADLRAAYLLSHFPENFETVKDWLKFLASKDSVNALEENKSVIINKLDLLNDPGLEKVNDYIDDLTEIDKYRNDK